MSLYACTTPLYLAASPGALTSACIRILTTSVGCALRMASVPVVTPAAIRTKSSPTPEFTKIMNRHNEMRRESTSTLKTPDGVNY